MVRVPVSDAMWATWKRYCAALGVSMGHGIAELIGHELLVAAAVEDESGAFVDEIESRLLRRSDELDRRERILDRREQDIRKSAEILRTRIVPYQPSRTEPSRNDRCPCGSGAKYKRCHGA
jgi:preprotein translocase subunit SecA